MLWLLLTLLVAATEKEQTVISEPEITKTIESSVVTIESIDSKEKTAQPVVQPITITNAIEPSMLSYKHWTGTYSPELFTVTLNGTQIDSGQTYVLACTENALTVHIEYSFMNGIYKGNKTISYTMNADCAQAKLTFSWLDPYKVIIDNATPITEETI